jgi:hypothetical protein
VQAHQLHGAPATHDVIHTLRSSVLAAALDALAAAYLALVACLALSACVHGVEAFISSLLN